MRAVAEGNGLLFVEHVFPDITPDGVPGVQERILEDVKGHVADCGPDTAFFGTNCAMQEPLIKKVIDEGAIFPGTCCPSPYHAFPAALGIDASVPAGTDVDSGSDVSTGTGSLRPPGELVEEIRSVIASRGATGRLAAEPVPLSMMFTAVGAEYAIKWVNGEVPQEKGFVDHAVFKELCQAYIYETYGERLGVGINPLSYFGSVYNNYLLVVTDSIVF